MEGPLKRTGKIEITAIKRQRTTNMVYLSNGHTFPCDFETTLNNRLYVKKTLTSYELKKILEETKTSVAIRKYVNYLNKYKVSKSYFKERLAQKEGLNEEQIKKIMFELDNRRHLFDNLALRKEYLEYYLSKGYSFKECEKKLAQKRIFYFPDNLPFDEKIERKNLLKQINALKPKYEKYGPLAKNKLRNALINNGFKMNLIDEELKKIKFSDAFDMNRARLDAIKQKRSAKDDKQKFYRGMYRKGYPNKIIHSLMEEYFDD